MVFTKKLMLPLAALALVGAVAACDKVAPATPEPTPGPIAQSNALNGTYDLRASDCGNPASKTALIIDGNNFNFPGVGASCTVANSQQQVNRTQVTLSCNGGHGPTNRIIDLQSRPGVLRVTEDRKTATYYQCSRAEASSNTQPVLSQPRNQL
ncbi:hypothetical protein [Paracoccus aminophilus]|nr:hypothetical protein [Paracoccus aminophilus]